MVQPMDNKQGNRTDQRMEKHGEVLIKHNYKVRNQLAKFLTNQVAHLVGTGLITYDNNQDLPHKAQKILLAGKSQIPYLRVTKNRK